MKKNTITLLIFCLSYYSSSYSWEIYTYNPLLGDAFKHTLSEESSRLIRIRMKERLHFLDNDEFNAFINRLWDSSFFAEQNHSEELLQSDIGALVASFALSKRTSISDNGWIITLSSIIDGAIRADTIKEDPTDNDNSYAFYKSIIEAQKSK